MQVTANAIIPPIQTCPVKNRPIKAIMFAIINCLLHTFLMYPVTHQLA